MGLLKGLKKIAKVALPVVGSIVGGPVGGAIGKVGAGLLGSSGSKSAANAQVAGNQAGIDYLGGALDTATKQLQPYQQAGTDALSRLNALYTGDYSGFNNSPDYKYALDQGEQAINRAASAAGGRLSGNSILALNKNAQGLATQNLGNYTSRLMQLAGMGQGAAGAVANAGLNVGSQVAGLASGQGTARASGIVGSTNAWGNVIDGVVNGDANTGSGIADTLAGLLKKKPTIVDPALFKTTATRAV
jgi:hypothetical protein